MPVPALSPLEAKYLDSSPKILRQYFETWLNGLEEKIGASTAPTELDYTQVRDSRDGRTLQDDFDTLNDCLGDHQEDIDGLKDKIDCLNKTGAALVDKTNDEFAFMHQRFVNLTQENAALKDRIGALERDLAAAMKIFQDADTSLVNEVLELRRALNDAKKAKPAAAPATTSTVDDATLKALATWADATGKKLGMPFTK